MSSADRLPEDARAIRRVEAAICEAFAAAGYDEVIVPMVEDEEVYLSAADLRVVQGGRVLGLRADFTGPVARIACTRLRDERGPIRLCYRGVLFRDGRQQWHAGCECFGLAREGGDVEILRVALAATEAAGAREVRAVVGDVGALGHFDDETVRAALVRRDAHALAAHPAARDLLRGNAHAPYLDDLREQLGPRIVCDPAHVRPFPYYTGLVFDLYAPGFSRPIGGGGRYDALCTRYGNPRPAVGFSLDVELLARGAG